jgi:hypothetical protein
MSEQCSATAIRSASPFFNWRGEHVPAYFPDLHELERRSCLPSISTRSWAKTVYESRITLKLTIFPRHIRYHTDRFGNAGGFAFILPLV